MSYNERFLVLILLKITKQFPHCSQNINGGFIHIGIHLGTFTFLLLHPFENFEEEDEDF
jgi:hypothetical protein